MSVLKYWEVNYGINSSQSSCCNFNIVVNGYSNHARSERKDPVLVLSQVVLSLIRLPQVIQLPEEIGGFTA